MKHPENKKIAWSLMACTHSLLNSVLSSQDSEDGTRQFTVPLLHRKSCRDCSKRVQLALAVIYAVDCSGAEALNLGATATSQTGSVAQLELSFKVQRSKKSKRCARSLGISNLKNPRRKRAKRQKQKIPITSDWFCGVRTPLKNVKVAWDD